MMTAPEGNRTPVASLEGWCLRPLGHWSERQRDYAYGSPPESRTPLCGLRARCITRQCLRGVHPRSAREDSSRRRPEANLRAPAYQTGAWTGSATGGAPTTEEAVRLELTRRDRAPAGFRDRFLIQPVSASRIRWGRLEPPSREPQSRALPVELRTWIRGRSEEGSNLRGRFAPRRVSTPVPCRSATTPNARAYSESSRSAPTRRPPAYEAGALPAELQERVCPSIAGAGFEPASDTAYEAVLAS